MLLINVVLRPEKLWAGLVIITVKFFFAPLVMTGGALAQLRLEDALLGVMLHHFRRLVLVASVARVRLKIIRMARGTGDNLASLHAVIKRESMCDHRGWRPGRGAVAGSAICAEHPGVDLRLHMAGHALGRRAFELAVSVAGGTFDGGVCALEREKLAVIKVGGVARAVVAIQAGVAEGPSMFRHERGGGGAMAIGASLFGKRVRLARVARPAGER